MQRSVSICEGAHALVGINRDPLENFVLVTPVNVIEVRDRIDIRSRIGLFASIIFADRDEICGWWNGSGRNNTALSTLNTAVLAPIPSASVSTTTQANPGDLPSWRSANFKSAIIVLPLQASFGVLTISFGAQGNHGIDLGGSARRHEAGNQ